MIDHDKNLETVLEVRKTLAAELNELQSTMEQKKEMFLKYSGIIEYLSSLKKAEESNTPTSDIEIEGE